MDPDQADDLIEMALVEVDEEEFELHLKNNGKVQQVNVTGQDRLETDRIVLCGRLVEVVHGTHPKAVDGRRKPPVDVPHTLAVFEWYVHANDPTKRVKFAQIKIRFRSEAGGAANDPAVADCFPWGAYSLLATGRQVERARGFHPTLKLGQDGVATAEAAFAYDLKETLTRQEHVWLNGTPIPGRRLEDADWLTGVQWNLFENEGQRSGIPRYFRTAVLLERRPGDRGRFTAEIDVTLKVSLVEDSREKIRRFLGRAVRDDPAIFDPTEPPTTDRFDEQLAALGDVPLEDECVFLLFRKLSNPRGPKQEGDQGGGEAEDKEKASGDASWASVD